MKFKKLLLISKNVFSAFDLDKSSNLIAAASFVRTKSKRQRELLRGARQLSLAFYVLIQLAAAI
ncbi:hypothetical protein, partial [Pseudanabaena sp. 'Roaring Creek']|uniref:hypothetical protein n=1 Tax=Pseudanabaena sp. 'Roaring Creek' TaxID=1681830 RepID=UPI000AFC4868